MRTDKELALLAFRMRQLMDVALDSTHPGACTAIKHADRTMYVMAMQSMLPFNVDEEVAKECSTFDKDICKNE